MPTARTSSSRPPSGRERLAWAYALTICATVLVVAIGFGAVKRASDRAAGAVAMAQAADVRLSLDDDILGYAVALRQSNGSPTDQVQIALRAALGRLALVGGIDRDPSIALDPDEQRIADDLVDRTAATAVDLSSAGEALLVLERSDAGAGDDQVANAITSVADAESSDASALEAVARFASAAAQDASAAARDDEIAAALVLVVLLAAGIAFVIAPAHRAATGALERSVRSQEQNARIKSEVAKHVADRDRREAEAQFQTLFRSATLGVALTDESGIIIETNPALRRITGYGEDELCGSRFGAWESGLLEYPSTGGFATAFDTAASAPWRETRCARRDGSKFWAEVQISKAAGPDGRTVVCIAMVNDVTARKEAEDRLRHDATHDPLTGLNNRKVFLEEVDRALAGAASVSDKGFAVLFIDLDRFKFVNDARGHAFGDAVLTEVAERLRRWAGSGDAIARFGGDEFTALLPSIEDAGQAIRRTEQLQADLAAPMEFGDLPVRTSASIGICVWSPSVMSAEAMVQAADAAAYHAKANGRACSIVFDGEMAERDRVRTRIGMDLRTALERGQLRLVYQPVVDLKTHRSVGFEALLRWTHPETGAVSPDAFIPIAEESGLIVPIGGWAMRQAVGQLVAWRRDLPSADIAMNINVSAQQMANEVFVADLKSVLADPEVPAGSLYFELTETAVLHGDRLAQEVFAAIRRAGAHLVLDDFGMGYSSLAHLARLPIDALKIDRLFVSGANVDGLASPAIVRALIALARAMNLDVVAEGVESKQQEAELSAMGAKYAQGYLFGRPMEEPDARTFIETMVAPWGRAASG
jgi:diguanylate cyclase (GGDEF)-like protein/PAS domain S-box-containing protein